MHKALIVAALALLVPGVVGAQSDAPAAALNAHYTLDTPIKILIADPAAKAVLDKDLPGMSSDANLPKFEDKSLRALQPLSGGQLTDALLKQVAADLVAIGDDAVPATTNDGDKAAPANDSQTPNGR